MRNSPVRICAFLLALSIFACGTSQREKTLHATHIMLTATADGFAEWDNAQQKSIVDNATSYESGLANLQNHYARKTKVLEALVLAYRALSVAVTANNEASLQELLSAVKALKSAFDEVKKE